MSSRKRKNFTTNESDSHFLQMAEWLAMESQAEIDRMFERRKRTDSRNAEKSGESILDLAIAEHSTGLGGMKLVTFRRRRQSVPMPWHRLKVGSPVVVSSFPESDEASNSGVVSAQTRDSIQVALTRWPEGKCFRVDLTADEITRQRQLTAIAIAKESAGRLGRLREILMGERDPTMQVESDSSLEFQTNLNLSQQSAVHFALAANDLAIIHGPPGTGKTTTVVELIIQSIRHGGKVLACAPSNTAVDNLLERLIAADQRVVRIGHPARVAESLRDYSLDGLVESHENMRVINEMVREAESIFRQSEKWTRAKRGRGEKQALRQEAKRLMADARRLERQAVESILDRADVICATTTFNEEMLGDRWFDLCVIDEACQSVEPGCWVPLLRVDKVVLAGDHQQLPPTVLSIEAAKEGFAISLMERQMNLYGEAVSRLLSVQYRMHNQIMEFSSRQFYEGQLVADDRVSNHLLHHMDSVETNEWTASPVRFIDTAGAGWDEELEPDGESKRNPNEADLVLKYVQRLIDSGMNEEDIAVIAPYAAQVRLLRLKCSHGNLEIDTVDGFQGREKEAVVITLVRSNAINEIGFLADARRMNVALTRARRALIVIGDSSTLGGHEFYDAFFEYVESIGAYHSVWGEADD